MTSISNTLVNSEELTCDEIGLGGFMGLGSLLLSLERAGSRDLSGWEHPVLDP